MNKSLSCIGAFLLLFLAACNSVDDQQHLKIAKNYLAEGDVKSAIIELKNALQKNPENSVARVELGTIYQDHGNSIEAEKELRKAQQLGADDNEVLPSLSKALLQLRKIDDVLAMQSGHLKPQEQGDVLAAQGIAFLVAGKPQKAVELTERALGIAPGSAYVRVARASAYLMIEKSPEKAREQLKQAFEIDQNYAPAWGLLGDIEVNAEDLEAARDAYTKAITLQPTSLLHRNKRVTTNILLNDLEQAQYDLDLLKKQLPGNPGVAFSQGVVYMSLDRLDDAKSAFDIALLAQDRYPLSMFYLAYINYRQNTFEQAETHAERYFTVNPNHLPNRKLLAELKLKKHDYDGAEALLRPIVDSENADESVRNILAKTLLMRGKTAEGIALLNRIVEQTPDSADTRLRLGASLMMSGNLMKGIDQFETAIQLDQDNHQADIYRILSYLNLGETDKAHQAAVEFKVRAPESEVPYNMIGMVYIAERNFKDARDALQESWEIKPGNTDAGHNLSELALIRGDYDEARDYLGRVIKVHPDNLGTLIKLAELDALEGKTQQQIQRLEQAMRLYPNAVKPRLALAEHYINTGNPGQVSGLIETLDTVTKKQMPVLEVITNQALAQKEFKAAERTAREIIDRNPNAPQGYFLLAKALAGIGNVEQVEKMLGKAIEKDGRYLPARIVWARLLLSRRDIPAIEKELSSLKTIAADNENVMKLEITLEEIKGNPKQAYNIAEQVFEAFPNIGNMLVLSRHKLRAGDNDGALQLRVDWAEDHKTEYYPNLILAVTYTRQGKHDLAVKYYQRALTASPENTMVLNNLAWSLRNTDTEQALAYAQKANRIKPGSVTLMDTLAMVYLANQQSDQALDMIKKVLYLEPDNPTFRYHEAMINVAAGDSDRAVRILSDLLDGDKGEHEGFSERVDAVSLLEKLKG